MIHKRKKKEKSESCFKFNAYCLSSKKNTVSNNSFSEKQKGGVNFKATCNLSTPFSGTFITRRHKKKFTRFSPGKFLLPKFCYLESFCLLCPWSKKQLGILGMSFLSCSLFRGLNCKSCFADSSSIFTFPSVVRPQTWHPSISPLYDILVHYPLTHQHFLVTQIQIHKYTNTQIQLCPQTRLPSISPLYDILDHTNQIFSESWWHLLSTDPLPTPPSPRQTHHTKALNR